MTKDVPKQKIHVPKQPVSIAFEIMFMPDNKDNLITRDTKDIVYSCNSQNRYQQVQLPSYVLQSSQSFEEVYQKMQEIEYCVKNDEKDNKIINQLCNNQNTPIIRQSPIAPKYSYNEDTEQGDSEPILSDTIGSQIYQQQELREKVLKSQQRHKDLEQQQMEKISEQMEKIRTKTEKIKQQKILYALQIKEKSKEQTMRGLQKKHEIEQQKIQQARLQLLKVEKAKQKREQQKHELFEKIQRNMIENDNRRRKYMENKQERLHTFNTSTGELQLQHVLWQGYADLFANLQNGDFLQLLSETTDCQQIQLILNNFQLNNIKEALTLIKSFLQDETAIQRCDYLYILFYALMYSLLTQNDYQQRNSSYSASSYEFQILRPQQQSDSVYQIPGIIYESEYLCHIYTVISALLFQSNRVDDDYLQFYYWKLQQFESGVKNTIQCQFLQKYANCQVLEQFSNNVDQILLNVLISVILQKVDYPIVVSEKYILQMKTSKQKQKYMYDQFSSCQYALKLMNVIISNNLMLEVDQLIKYYELLISQAAQIVLSKATYSASQQQIENINVQSETLYSEFTSILYSLLQQINSVTLLLQDKLAKINDIDYNTTKQEILIILQNLFSRKILYNENLIEMQQEFIPRQSDIFKFKISNQQQHIIQIHDDQRFLFTYQLDESQYKNKSQISYCENDICSDFIKESIIFAIRVGKIIQYPYHFFEDVIINLPGQCFISKQCCQLLKQLAEETNYNFTYEQNLVGLV